MRYILLSILMLNVLLGSAQFENETFYGVSGGAYFANKNTAIMYTGGNVAIHGVEYYIPSSQSNQNTIYIPTDIDDYFSYDYWIAELPQNPAYRPAMQIGLFAGKNLGNGTSFFAEVSAARIDYEQVFTVQIADVSNPSPDDVLQQIPLFGLERRMNINAGLQIGLYTDEKTNVYLPLMACFNNTRMEKNYFVINNKQYPIYHHAINPNVTTIRINPGGSGFGLSTGIGVKYAYNESFVFDVGFQTSYHQVAMNSEFKPWGLHHVLQLRICKL